MPGKQIRIGGGNSKRPGRSRKSRRVASPSKKVREWLSSRYCLSPATWNNPAGTRKSRRFQNPASSKIRSSRAECSFPDLWNQRFRPVLVFAGRATARGIPAKFGAGPACPRRRIGRWILSAHVRNAITGRCPFGCVGHGLRCHPTAVLSVIMRSRVTGRRRCTKFIEARQEPKDFAATPFRQRSANRGKRLPWRLQEAINVPARILPLQGGR